MDKLKSTPPVSSELKITKPASKLLPVLLGFLLVIIIGLAAALWWCWYKPGTPAATPPAGTVVASGPCFEGAANDLPAGYTWYENADLGYKFAYPNAWGAVTVTAEPMSGLTGDYASGHFASNENVFFGGNATDHVVMGRGGMYTDLPGYLEASGKFYTVKIWKYNDGTTTEPQYGLYPIESPTVRKDACNTHAAVTQFPYDAMNDYSADVAHINLQPTNIYYGVNFVLKNPTAESRADLDKIIRSFQLIP